MEYVALEPSLYSQTKTLVEYGLCIHIQLHPLVYGGSYCCI